MTPQDQTPTSPLKLKFKGAIRSTATELNLDNSRGYLVPSVDGWLLVTRRGRTRAMLRISHGWTEQTANEALMIQEGDVLP